MPSSELINYACYGSMTREVAETLLNRSVHWTQARVPLYGLRMLTHNMMSEAERKVMQGTSRFIVVPDHRYTMGVRGGVILGLPTEETAVLQFFDNSSEKEYEVLLHQVVAVTERSTEVIEYPLQAILVARKKMHGRNYGERRHPREYNPYEPFGVRGRVEALETAQAVRESFLNSLQR